MYYELLAPGDDYNHTFKWEPMYQDTYNTPASDGMAAQTWRDFWNGVFAANLAIDRIQKFEGEIDQNRKNRLLGEAYFLRALNYLHLGMLFGETIPLISKPVETNEDYYPGNAAAGAVYALIVDDFKKASELLPTRAALYADSKMIGRATKGAAQAYLAKTYLYKPILAKGQAADFANAEIQLKSVIDSKEYQLMSSYRDNFLETKENNQESVFEVQLYNGPGWLGTIYRVHGAGRKLACLTERVVPGGIWPPIKWPTMNLKMETPEIYDLMVREWCKVYAIGW
ncbi:RagB/SusD family nutrient uptake outer membrane protein [Sphingobacterium sp. E70]|uniref:RagB/SusD family nutrient uptake outer membrane protein n=1 Tax=Sphingobacterium sp. E70 TaxID=2853439 RepID=UPI00211C727B|nr:RagB/SusD family nutrient uptake outer membrane protein [Sphingobacterium sp. E70]ULT25146.1 RagB/SusD family nutrient uptake outer membrane protein [Sphingobacterium sp. E70]